MGKYLEALKLLYGEDDNNYETLDIRTDKTDRSPFVSDVSSVSEPSQCFASPDSSIPFTDQELAESQIDQLKLRDDRVFVRKKLIGIYGAKRLEIVNQYLAQWQSGMDAEPVEIKKENAGRFSANSWINEYQIDHALLPKDLSRFNSGTIK